MRGQESPLATRSVKYAQKGDVLLVQLGRFTNPRWNVTKKLHNKINFPLRLGFSKGHKIPIILEGKYHLFAATLHHGRTYKGGHYTSRALVEGQWYDFNDSCVKAFEWEVDKENRVTCDNVYLLYYLRGLATHACGD